HNEYAQEARACARTRHDVRTPVARIARRHAPSSVILSRDGACSVTASLSSRTLASCFPAAPPSPPTALQTSARSRRLQYRYESPAIRLLELSGALSAGAPPMQRRIARQALSNTLSHDPTASLTAAGFLLSE